LISRAHGRFAVEAETSVNSSMVAGSSPWAFRRLPRFTLLYQPEYRTRCSPAFGIWAVRAASQAEHALAEEVLQGIQINLRERDEPARRAERPIGDQGVQVGMEVHQVPVGLDGNDDARNGSLVFARGTEEGFQRVDSALA
jgi:hypothetical protein